MNSACHFGHACHRFVSPGLYQGNIWALLATGNIANEHPTLSFPLLIYKRLKNKRLVCFCMTWRLLCCHLFPKLPENVTATDTPHCFKHTFSFIECKPTRRLHSIARATVVAKASLGGRWGGRSLAAVPKGLQNGREMGGNEHFT